MQFSTPHVSGFWAVLVVCFFFVNQFAQDKPKLKPEDVLFRHLESIGPVDALSASANRKIEGSSQVRRVRDASSLVKGGSFLASTADKFVLMMVFEASGSDDYRGERINFDGQKLDIPFVTASQRSAVGEFIFLYPEIAKQYLLGGTLFSSWALWDAKNKIGKFDLQGKEKIGEIETYKVRVAPKSGSSLNIRMFFDTTTFRHVRTEYERTETAGTVRVDEGRVSETRYKLIEDFSDFKPINGLSLPTTYKITFRVDTFQRSREFEWLLKLSRFAFDKQIAPEVFRQVP